jgi:hypothetical protein
MTDSDLAGELAGLHVERALEPVTITQAGRISVPLQLRRGSAGAPLTALDLVLTADAAQELCEQITGILSPVGQGP